MYKTPSIQEIKEELVNTRERLAALYNCFDNVTDPILIDSIIYEINATEKRIQYLHSQLISSVSGSDFQLKSVISDSVEPLSLFRYLIFTAFLQTIVPRLKLFYNRFRLFLY